METSSPAMTKEYTSPIHSSWVPVGLRSSLM